MDQEADVYDTFNFMRERFLGGWEMLEDSALIKLIDEQIEREYKREVRAGKWKSAI